VAWSALVQPAQLALLPDLCITCMKRPVALQPAAFVEHTSGRVTPFRKRLKTLAVPVSVQLLSDGKLTFQDGNALDARSDALRPLTGRYVASVYQAESPLPEMME
jgi:hypothetical protein